MPLPPKAEVRRAGKRAAAAGDISKVAAQDLEILDEWRRAHLRPLSAIAMWLRKPALDATDLAPAQRLKRRDTLLDKLISGRAKDASTMNDLGGCRLIFSDIESLNEFRIYLEKKSRARHKLTHDRSRYDYIESPKKTGYRGVHYVYSYIPSANNENSELHGLKIEIQLRTAVQHAWATAVEIADLVSNTRTKFEEGDGKYGEFFQVSSELLARSHEARTSCLPEQTTVELRERFRGIEEEIGLMDRLAKLREKGDIQKIKNHTVLAFRADGDLDIFGFTKSSRAVEKERELLTDEIYSNVVYARASTPRSIRSSFRNYFSNTEDFVELMNRAVG